jgi:hypothetical protein
MKFENDGHHEVGGLEMNCLGTSADLTHIRGPLDDLLKEVLRRAELRPRLEAEMGRSLRDEEFIQIADQTGMRI